MAGRTISWGPDGRTWSVGEERYRVLQPLAAAEQTTAVAVDAAARELGIQRAHCYRLLRRLRADPTVTALLPRTRGRASGVRMLSAEIEKRQSIRGQ